MRLAPNQPPDFLPWPRASASPLDNTAEPELPASVLAPQSINDPHRLTRRRHG